MEVFQRNGFVAMSQYCSPLSHSTSKGKILVLLNNIKIIQFKDRWSIRRKVC